jgi:hypothetical protein
MNAYGLAEHISAPFTFHGERICPVLSYRHTSKTGCGERKALKHELRAIVQIKDVLAVNLVLFNLKPLSTA